MQRPTIVELNQDNDAVRDQLLLLRILGTSDLTFLHQLYRPATLLDICKVAMDLLMQDPDHGLNEEEFTEYNNLFNELVRESCSHKV